MCPRCRRRIFSRRAADDAAGESKALLGFSFYAGKRRAKTQGRRISTGAETGARQSIENEETAYRLGGVGIETKGFCPENRRKKGFCLLKVFSVAF